MPVKATSALTPSGIYDGRLAVQLPPKMMPAFLFLSELSLTRPEIAAFPTFFLSAIAGNKDAIRKVLEIVFIAYEAAVGHAKTKDDRAIANCVVFLGNSLAAMLERGELTYEDAPPKPEIETEIKTNVTQKAAPVKADKYRPKQPAQKFSSHIKPGTARQESK